MKPAKLRLEAAGDVRKLTHIDSVSRRNTGRHVGDAALIADGADGNSVGHNAANAKALTMLRITAKSGVLQWTTAKLKPHKLLS